MNLAFCTISTIANLAMARLLRQSLERFHPDSSFHLLLCESPETAGEVSPLPGETILTLPQILGDRWADLAFGLTERELPTALIPYLLERILEGGSNHVIYLSPGHGCFSPLDRMPGFSEGVPLTLLSRFTSFPPISGHLPQEGGYDRGFAAVTDRPETRELLAWWKGAVKILTSREIFPLLPSLAQTAVVRSPSFCASFETIAHHPVSRTGESWTVDGAPLALFRFFPPSPGDEATGDGHPLAAYRHSLLSSVPGADLAGRPWSLGFYDNGEPVTPDERRAWRALSPEMRADVNNPYREGADPASPIRRQAAERIREEHASVSDQIELLRKRIDLLSKRNELFTSSLSWRVTAPLRWIHRHLTGGEDR